MGDIKDVNRPQWARPKRDKYRFIKMLTLTFAVVSFGYWAFAEGRPRYSPFDEPLRFTENGTFQISIFEDLHFGEGMFGPLSIKTVYLYLHGSCLVGLGKCPG